MSDTYLVAGALGAVAAVATLRLLWQQWRGVRLGWPRFGGLLILQLLATALLFCSLVPPRKIAHGEQIVLLTAAADAAGTVPVAPAGRLFALPEATSAAGSEAMPDLASVLRRHPGTPSLLIVGDGLAARDRGTVLPPSVALQAPPPPRGWIALQPPDVATPGALFAVRARAQGVPGAQAELRDPAGQVVSRGVVDAAGVISLDGVARVAGETAFQLRLLDAQQHVVDTVPVPLQVQAPPAVRLRILAAAPGAEPKYLRRWAADAGLEVQMQASTGAGVSLGDAPATLSASQLASLDLLILDERSLGALNAAQRATIHSALRGGLGVLVRTSGPLPEATRQILRGWGMPVTGGGRITPLQLDTDDDSALLSARRGPRRATTDSTDAIVQADIRSHAAAVPELEQLDVSAGSAQALLHDGAGAAVGGWRQVGRGRMGLLPVIDSYRLVLAGRDDRHAELWSGVAGTLARPLASTGRIRVDAPTPWSGERVVLCDVPPGTVAHAPDGTTQTLLIDPASAHARCAAWWPRTAGWHALVHADTSQAVYVFDPAEASSLHRQQTREATLALVAGSARSAANTVQLADGPRWPWWLAFVLVSGLLWWLERRPGIPR